MTTTTPRNPKAADRPPCIAVVPQMPSGIRDQVEEVNDEDAAIEAEEAEFKADWAAFCERHSEAYHELLATAQAEAVEFQDRQRELITRKVELGHRIHPLLRECRPAYAAAVEAAERDEAKAMQQADVALREQGIDESSTIAGSMGGANPEAVQIQWNHRLRQEPLVQAAMGKTAKARNALAVLESRFPILPTEESAAVPLPSAGDPTFIAAVLKV